MVDLQETNAEHEANCDLASGRHMEPPKRFHRQYHNCQVNNHVEADRS